MTHIKFCDCLKRLLTDLGISSSRLAKAINVDSSLVNRWINGKRIPSYHADYIENIADYLCKNIHNTFQEQLIHSLTTDICGSITPAKALKDQIQFLLKEAQGYSVECAQKEKVQKKMHLPNKSCYAEVMGLHHDIPMSDNDRLLTDQFQITNACLSLIDAALAMEKPVLRTIYMVYDNHFFPDLWNPSDIMVFMNKLKLATHRGFQIVLLLRLNYDTTHTVTMMECIKPFLLKGKITLYYVPPSSYTLPEQGLLFVPDVGLITGFSNEFISAYHYAFYLTCPAVLDLCLSHLELFLKEHASLLLTQHHSNKSNFIHIHQMEQGSGCHFLLRYSFGMMTFPVSLYRKLIKRLNYAEEEYEKSMLLYQNLLNDFFHNIQHYPYFDIYSSSCLDELVKNHQIHIFSYKGVRNVTLDVPEIIEHLEHIIHLLETYGNYQIAFYKPSAEGNISIKNVYCLVKERNSVLFELLRPTDSAGNLRIYSEEPMLTGGFCAYLKNIWERIPPVNKSKYDVIHWLSNTIRILQGEPDHNAFLSKL